MKKRSLLAQKSAFILFVALFFVCAFQIFRIFTDLQREQNEFARLTGKKSASESEIETQSKPEKNEEGTAVLAKYRLIYQENPDLAGWIHIDGTKIDYPVMSTPQDKEFYLHRGFDKNESFSGVPFLDTDSSLDGNHTVIYGHNMKNKTMFATLFNYKSKEFWKEHPTIQLDSLYEERIYEVMGVFYSKIYSKQETGGFRYYEYVQLPTQEKFEEYCYQVKKASLYDTGVRAEKDDQLLTLSTCSYQVKDGRFVVVARRIQ